MNIPDSVPRWKRLCLIMTPAMQFLIELMTALAVLPANKSNSATRLRSAFEVTTSGPTTEDRSRACLGGGSHVNNSLPLAGSKRSLRLLPSGRGCDLLLSPAAISSSCFSAIVLADYPAFARMWTAIRESPCRAR
jgi:hypothetical protein